MAALPRRWPLLRLQEEGDVAALLMRKAICIPKSSCTRSWIQESGLRTARRISHVYLMDVPDYSRLLLITGCGHQHHTNCAAGKGQHRLEITIDLAHMLGVAQPRVAILAAVETVSSKMRSTIDAAALCKMADRRSDHGRGSWMARLRSTALIQRGRCRMKGITSPVAGRAADILVVPDLEAGNMLAKQLSFLAGAEAARLVLGARVPIILTSRADSARTRLASCALYGPVLRWPGASRRSQHDRIDPDH